MEITFFNQVTLTYDLWPWTLTIKAHAHTKFPVLTWNSSPMRALNNWQTGAHTDETNSITLNTEQGVIKACNLTGDCIILYHLHSLKCISSLFSGFGVLTLQTVLFYITIRGEYTGDTERKLYHSRQQQIFQTSARLDESVLSCLFFFNLHRESYMYNTQGLGMKMPSGLKDTC